MGRPPYETPEERAANQSPTPSAMERQQLERCVAAMLATPPDLHVEHHRAAMPPPARHWWRRSRTRPHGTTDVLEVTDGWTWGYRFGSDGSTTYYVLLPSGKIFQTYGPINNGTVAYVPHPHHPPIAVHTLLSYHGRRG